MARTRPKIDRGLNPARAGAGAARLVQRVWLYGPTDAGVTTSRTVNTTVPDGARWVDARAIGSGGGREGAGSHTGGGAAYARGGGVVLPRGTVTSVVGGQAAISSDGVDSTVAVGSAVIVRAAGGKVGTVGGAGAGGAAAGCVGTTIRAGSAGGASYGGASGSDAADADPLGIGGEARRSSGDARATDGTQPPTLTDYGAGGSGNSGDPPASSPNTGWTGDGRYGGPGIVVLEFWTKKPRTS